MAVPSNTYQTYTTVGIKEDISEEISNIASTETPFIDGIGKGKATQKFTEWQTDTLDAATADNAVIEGDDATTQQATPTVRLGNYTQLLEKVVRVSSSNQASDAAGRKNEMGYQVAKRGLELKRDIESMALSKNASNAGSASTARKSGGVGAWLETNTSHGASGGAAGGWNSGTSVVDAPTSGTNRALTETLFKGVIASAWAEGGNPTKVYTNSGQKEKISGFSGIATLYRDTGSSRKQASIMGAADLYISDFGEHKVIANRFMPTDCIYVVDHEFWGLKYLQNMKQKELAKTGHSDRRLLSCELTLCSKNEKASAGVFDLS